MVDKWFASNAIIVQCIVFGGEGIGALDEIPPPWKAQFSKGLQPHDQWEWAVLRNPCFAKSNHTWDDCCNKDGDCGGFGFNALECCLIPWYWAFGSRDGGAPLNSFTPPPKLWPDYWSRRAIQQNVTAGCDFAFLDIGSNYGQSILRFVSALATPLTDSVWNRNVVKQINPLRRLLREFLWEFDEEREFYIGPSDFCVLAVEADSWWEPSLLHLKKEFGRLLHGMDVLTRLAITGRSGNVTFYLSDDETSSVNPEHYRSRQNGNINTVESLTLTKLLDITERLGNLRGLVVKLDIEGAEYDALAESIASGAWCRLTSSGTKVMLLPEWHAGNSSAWLPKEWKGNGRAFPYLVPQLLRFCNVRVADGKWTFEGSRRLYL